MNQKGFAISGILYSILVLFLVLITVMLFNLQNKKTLLDKLKSDTVEAIEGESTYEFLLNEINSIKSKIYPVGSIYTSVTDDTVEKVQARFGGTWVAFGSGKTLVGVDTNQTEFNTVEKSGGEKTHTLTINEMPSHTHTFTGTSNQLTGNNNQDHTHSGNTGYISNDHAHYFSGTTSNPNTADITFDGGGILSEVVGVGCPTCGAGIAPANGWVKHDSIRAGTFYLTHTHTYSGWTGGVNSNHYHSFTTGGQSQAHNHYFTATGSNSSVGGSQTHNNLQPYITVYMYKRIA